MSKHLDPRIDAYIAKAAPFAQPILKHLRDVVHRASPAVTETLKWGMPHFQYNDGMLCGMAAFKAHCTFGFWHQGMGKILGTAGAKADAAMGSLGRITSLSDLPPENALVRYVQAAMKLADSGVPARPRPTKGFKKELPVPPDLAAALKKNKTAATTFAEFSPSHRREYIEWITEAKREETRATRLVTTLEWLAKGKARNWKYAKC